MGAKVTYTSEMHDNFTLNVMKKGVGLYFTIESRGNQIPNELASGWKS